MAKNITPTSSTRRRPHWQLSRLLKRAGVTQWELARQAGVSQSFVSVVLARRASPGLDPAKVESVWRAVERVLEVA